MAREKASLIPKMGSAIASLQEENGAMRDVLLSMPGRSSVLAERPQSAVTTGSTPTFVLPSSKPDTEAGIAIDSDVAITVEEAIMSSLVSNAATQTFDTAFVSCEACARMQQNLIDVGTAMIELCESQGLQSSLAKQKKQLKKSLMAVTDINRWTTEQNRDIERINKHLELLFNEIEPLKLELEKSRQCNRKLREQVKELMGAKEQVEMKLVEKEKESILKVEMLSDEHQKKESLLKEEIKELTLGKANAEDRIAVLEEECIDKKKRNHNLEKEVARISKSFKEEKLEKERLKDFEEDFYIMKEELVSLREKIAEKEIELGKAQTENKALTKHGKTIQAKQEMLLQRADHLDQECEQLQSRLVELEDEKERLFDENKVLNNKRQMAERSTADFKALFDKTSKEKAALENDVKSLQDKISNLESEIANTFKQLTLLSEFPISDVTNGEHLSQFVGSVLIERRGLSLHDDVAKQVKANKIRIAILEERNDVLRQALASYEEGNLAVPSEIPKDRVPLWETGPLTLMGTKEGRQAKSKLSHLTLSESRDYALASDWAKSTQNTPINLKITTSSGSSPIPPSQPRTVTSKLNEKRQVYTGSAQKLRNSRTHCAWSDVGIVSRGQKAASKNTENSNREPVEDEYETTDAYKCPDCSKMYANGRDLQIHKSFCYGNM